MTPPDAENLIYAYPISEYKRQYDAKVSSDPYAEDCPADYPYYSKVEGKCVKCPSDAPYFNLHNGLCQSCGDVGYDKEKRQCASE